jgi:hypothetical protein
MNHAAATFAMGLNDPTPAVSGNGAAITPRPASSTELVSDGLPIFLWRMMPESANLLQANATMIEICAIPRGAF